MACARALASLMVLLDTCTLLWVASTPDKLSPTARQTIRSSAGSIYVSAISSFEIALKHRRGALTLPLPPEEWLAEVVKLHGFTEAPISSRIAARSALLPLHHNDPADRILVATAKELGAPIVTPDALIKAYSGIRVIW